MDRLTGIERRFARDGAILEYEHMQWLITEVRRLRLADASHYRAFNAISADLTKANKEIERLRTLTANALQATRTGSTPSAEAWLTQALDSTE